MEPVLTKLMQMEPSRYHFIRDKSQQDCIGFIAQDVKQLFPELVDALPVYDSTSKNTSDWYGMNYSGLGVITVKAIQEQQQIIALLQKEIDALKKRLDAVEGK